MTSTHSADSFASKTASEVSSSTTVPTTIASVESLTQSTGSATANKEVELCLEKKESKAKTCPKTEENQKEDKKEYLLQPNEHRFVLFPIQHQELWKMYKKHEACFWTTEEIDLGSDLRDWNTLNEGEKHFIKMVLAFFAASDGIVMENLALKFFQEIQVPEARSFYSIQLFMENVHSETYSLLIDTYVQDNVEKNKLFQAIQHFPCITQKANWALKWINNEKRFAERLVAFACVEGIGFSGAFCAIFWLKKRSLLPGLTFSNELISRDEGLHCDFACLLYSMLTNKLTTETVHTIIKECVVVEKQFILDALPVALIGMNANLMSTYIEFVADRLSDALGYPKIYNVANPFPWMEMIALSGKTNFFEKRVGEYSRARMTDVVESRSFSTDADF